MKGKFIKTLLIILIIICAGLGTYGYMNSKKDTQKPITNTKNKITYVYYLEDIEQETMPVNPDGTPDENGITVPAEPLYKFSRFSCSNNLTGDFDIDNWKFIPSNAKSVGDSTCKLYFVKAKYDVTLTITNGSEDETNPKSIEREKDGQFIIQPTEGYEYSTSVCSDNKEGSWDESTNTFTLNAIMKDVTCKIVFTVKELKADITVKNGKGTSTENAKYGESISSIIEPNDGYEKPTISCTNKQEGTFDNNKFTIAKLTDNTSCTITFNKVETVYHTLKINNLANLTITSGSNEQKIENGKDAKFTIESKDTKNENIKLECGGPIAKRDQIDDDHIQFTFTKVTNDITCNLEIKN